MDIEKAIEISELKNEIASYCKTISGKELVNKIRFLTDFSKPLAAALCAACDSHRPHRT